MKRILKWKVLLSLCCIWLATIDTKAQLMNESFENWCGSMTINGGKCPTFDNMCVPGWYRAHGTPEISTSSAPDGSNFVKMWAGKIAGEGIMAPHNFIAGKQYRICMWVRNDVNAGNIIVVAANGLAPVPDADKQCAILFPVPPSFEIMYMAPLVWNTGWKKISFDYSPSTNYSIFWIFPKSNTHETTVWLNVDDIEVTQLCDPIEIFNMASNTTAGTIPGGYYNKTAHIFAGSSAGGAPVGSGTVTSDPNAHVTFEAGTLVLISENFTATPNSGQLFHALIGPCDDMPCEEETIEGTEDTQGDPDEPYVGDGGDIPPGDSRSNDNGLYTETQVYPNPTTGILRVITRYDAETAYEVTTITGQVLMKGKVRNNQTLDIGEYPPGIYLLKITEGITGHQSTHRIVKEQ